MGTALSGSGTEQDPWVLETPPRSSTFEMYLAPEADPPAIVCQVKATQLRYHLRAIDDAVEFLRAQGDWVELGNADEGKPVKDGSLEAWARSESNPVGGYYGFKKGLRGRFGNYVGPLLEHLGHVELEHEARGNRVRAAAL